jgi:hypothetical protein
MVAARIVAVLGAIAFVPFAAAAAQSLSPSTPVPLTSKLTGLAGQWTRDPSRGTGSICGVRPEDTIEFGVSDQAITVGSVRLNARLSLDGTPAMPLIGLTATAALDAGWLKVTVTRERAQGFANIMQDAYLLNRDATVLTVWRVLNTRRPDGTSGKIDCGNRQAIVYVRSSKN